MMTMVNELQPPLLVDLLEGDTSGQPKAEMKSLPLLQINAEGTYRLMKSPDEGSTYLVGCISRAEWTLPEKSWMTVTPYFLSGAEVAGKVPIMRAVVKGVVHSGQLPVRRHKSRESIFLLLVDISSVYPNELREITIHPHADIQILGFSTALQALLNGFSPTDSLLVTILDPTASRDQKLVPLPCI